MSELKRNLSNFTTSTKILLSILLSVYGFLYRLSCAVEKNDLLGIIVVSILFIPFGFIFIFIDIIFIIIKGEVWSFD